MRFTITALLAAMLALSAHAAPTAIMCTYALGNDSAWHGVMQYHIEGESDMETCQLHLHIAHSTKSLSAHNSGANFRRVSWAGCGFASPPTTWGEFNALGADRAWFVSGWMFAGQSDDRCVVTATIAMDRYGGQIFDLWGVMDGRGEIIRGTLELRGGGWIGPVTLIRHTDVAISAPERE